MVARLVAEPRDIGARTRAQTPFGGERRGAHDAQAQPGLGIVAPPAPGAHLRAERRVIPAASLILEHRLDDDLCPLDVHLERGAGRRECDRGACAAVGAEPLVQRAETAGNVRLELGDGRTEIEDDRSDQDRWRNLGEGVRKVGRDDGLGGLYVDRGDPRRATREGTDERERQRRHRRSTRPALPSFPRHGTEPRPDETRGPDTSSRTRSASGTSSDPRGRRRRGAQTPPPPSSWWPRPPRRCCRGHRPW